MLGKHSCLPCTTTTSCTAEHYRGTEPPCPWSVLCRRCDGTHAWLLNFVCTAAAQHRPMSMIPHRVKVCTQSDGDRRKACTILVWIRALKLQNKSDVAPLRTSQECRDDLIPLPSAHDNGVGHVRWCGDCSLKQPQGFRILLQSNAHQAPIVVVQQEVSSIEACV